jgi:single-strand DNA-binding protein
MNKITIVGNLGKDPELKFTPSGQATAKFSLATSRKVKDEWVSTWHSVVAWGQLAENIASSCQKGDRVVVIGRYDNREWEDKNNNKRVSYEISAEEVAVSMKNAVMNVSRVEYSGKNEEEAF